MTGFVLAAVALAALALVFVLPPLWRGSRASAIAIAIALPLAAGLLYTLIGTPRALDPQARQAPVPPMTLDQAIGKLTAELKRNPENVQAWRLLGRSRKAQERYDEARNALARAQALAPEDPGLMVEYAEAITLTSPTRRIEAEALALIERALARDPDNQRGLWFLGIAQMQAGKPAQAVAAWEKLLPLVDAGIAGALREQLARARAQADLPPVRDEAAAPAGPTLRVTVDLAPQLRAKLADGDTLFVFARQPEGPAMPLAVKRLPAVDFPIEVALGDADGPMPTLKLSSVPAVRLLARVSKSGDAAARPGDLETAPQEVMVQNPQPLTLTIDRVVE